MLDCTNEAVIVYENTMGWPMTSTKIKSTYIFFINKYRVYLKWAIWGVGSPQRNRRKSSQFINIGPQTYFEVQPPRSPDVSPSRGHLKSLVYSAAIENEETLHQCTFYACQTTRNHTGTFERARQSTIRRIHWSSWWTFRAFIVNCDLKNNNKLTVVKFRRWIVNALCQL